MEKFIPYEKLSKKQQKAVNAKARRTWGPMNPVTRKPANSKAYQRQKAKQWKRDPSASPFIVFYNAIAAVYPLRTACWTLAAR